MGVARNQRHIFNAGRGSRPRLSFQMDSSVALPDYAAQPGARSVSLRRPVCIVSCGTANRTARATGCVGPSSRLKRLHCRSAQILPQPRPCCQPTTLGMVTFSLFRLPLPACWEGEGYRALAWADAATSASHGDLSCSGALPPRAEGSSASRAEGTAQHQEYGQHQEDHLE